MIAHQWLRDTTLLLSEATSAAAQIVRRLRPGNAVEAARPDGAGSPPEAGAIGHPAIYATSDLLQSAAMRLRYFGESPIEGLVPALKHRAAEMAAVGD